MIDYQLVNVMASLVDGKINAIKFVLLAVDGDITEKASWHTPCSLPEREAPYTQADYIDLAGSIAATNMLYTQLEAKINARKAALLPPAPPVEPSVSDSVRRAAMVKQVDDFIGTVITKAMRFQMGYLEREAEATRYKASGYAGTPNSWVTRFADNVKMPYKNAADLILSQAAKLRKDNKDLEDLRMDKYLIASAPTMVLAEAHFNRIMRNATAIEKTI